MKKLLYFLFFIFCSTITFSQNVGIGTINPDSTAALEINSTTQGFLPPRMNLSQRNAIQNPAQGLMVYCTDCGIDGGVQVYKGTEWQSLVSTSLFAYTSNQLKQGLIAYYPFNGNANDLSQNANNGNVFGATLTTDRFGLINRAYAFDGIDDYISVPNSNSLNQMNVDFTVSFWATSEFFNLFEVFSKGISLDSTNTIGTFRGNFFLSLGSNYAGVFQNGYYTGFGPQTDFFQYSAISNWNHFIVMKKRGVLIVYINGENIGINSLGDEFYQSSMNDTYPLLIGKGILSGYFYHKGKIDDIYLYNRALSSEEIIYLSTH